MLFRKVGKELQLYAAYYPRRVQIVSNSRWKPVVTHITSILCTVCWSTRMFHHCNYFDVLYETLCEYLQQNFSQNLIFFYVEPIPLMSVRTYQFLGHSISSQQFYWPFKPLKSYFVWTSKGIDISKDLVPLFSGSQFYKSFLESLTPHILLHVGNVYLYTLQKIPEAWNTHALSLTIYGSSRCLLLFQTGFLQDEMHKNISLCRM
jgi:hypothetical protein